jgi:hypothetical protein
MAPLIQIPSKQYPQLGCCAYCSATTQLSKEHIIPFGLGGSLVFLESSCDDCRRATSRVEDFVLRRYLCALRSFLSLPSRKPNQRPDGYKLTLRRGSREWTQKVTLAKHPGVIQFVMFDPPGRVAGRPRLQATFNVRLIEAKIFPDAEHRLARLGADTAVDRVTMNAMMLARMVAKIGHSFAVAELGLGVFEETYVRHLVQGEASDWNYWVGGLDRRRAVAPAALHELKFLRRGDDLSVIVHLFVPFCPQHAYEVVVGRLRHDVTLRVELEESAYPNP